MIRAYRIHTDVTNTTAPVVTFLKGMNVTIAYKGGVVTGLAIDDIRGFLYIADSSKNMILIYDFDKRSMRKNNQT